MMNLIIKQKLANGNHKVWKLKSTQEVHTFGTSRLADLISISPVDSGIQAVFEFKNGKWNFIPLSQDTLKKSSTHISINKPMEIKLNGSSLFIEPIIKNSNLAEEIYAHQSFNDKDKKAFQLYVVRQANKIIETKVLDLNIDYFPSCIEPRTAINCHPSEQWQKQQIGNFEISQKTIYLHPLEQLTETKLKDLIDPESKSGLYIMGGFTLLILLMALFTPKKPEMLVQAPQVVSQKILVKMDLKNKKTEMQKKMAAHAPAPQQRQPASAPQKPANVTDAVKALSAGGRLSQLIGKVSAQGSKTKNVIVTTNGVKAGSAPSGAALSTLAKIDRPGTTWGGIAKGKGVNIGTVGAGGGRSIAGYGSLKGGDVGNAGVGLIEDESEITGGLDREIIAQYIKTQLGQILYCYERQLSANPELYGKVSVKFTISGSGQVEEQKIGDTTLKNTSVEGCILKKVASWKFPAPQGGTKVIVTYPFLFKSTN